MKKTIALLLLAAALLVSCSNASDDAQDTSADTGSDITTAAETEPQTEPETIPETEPVTTEAPETEPPEPFSVEIKFKPNTDTEEEYIWDYANSNLTEQKDRFNDGTGYVIYRFPTGWNDKATLDIALINEFELSISSDDDEYEVIASSLSEGGSRKAVHYDLSKYTGGEYIYVRVGDADPSDGWGGLIPFNVNVIFLAGDAVDAAAQ